MNSQKNETQIAIIGATQSGKTTLAAGLAKTSSEDFTVGFANQTTSDYFQPRIAGISAGYWPEGNIGEDKDLGLKINTPGGRSALISFKEYMGERMNDENYLEHIVGRPNGALILLSPGMGLLNDPLKREKLVSNLKGIVDYLKGNKCVAVAFVVTACDRLKTDLKDFAEEFGNYAAEVTNYLNTSGMDWKRFDVTITGELADQQKPTIAVGDKNTAREPFVWIMDRVAGRKRMTATKRIFNLLCCLALAGAAMFGAVCACQFYSEYADLKTRENTVDQIKNKIASATAKKSESELKSATDDLATLIASNKTLSCRFQSLETRRTNDVAKWSVTYDEARIRYFLVSMDKRYGGRADAGSEENCAEFDKLLAEFAPTDSAKKTELTNRWAQLRPQIRKGYDDECGNEFADKLAQLAQKEKTKDLRKEVKDFKDKVSKWRTDFPSSAKTRSNVLDRAGRLIKDIDAELDLRAGNELNEKIDVMAKNAATQAAPSELEVLRQEIANWEPYTDGGAKCKDELSKSFGAKCLEWEQEYLDNSCATNAEEVVVKIRGLNPTDRSHPDEICRALKTAFGFTNEWAKASSNVLSVATNKINVACLKFLADFQNSLAGNWKVRDRMPPEISKGDKEFIEDALDLPNPKKFDEKLSVDFLNKLEQVRKTAEGEWINYRKKCVDEFIDKIKPMSVMSMYDKYRTMYEHDTFNLFIENARPEVMHVLSNLAVKVNSVVEHAVSKFFDEYLQELKKTFWESESAFNSDAGRKLAADRFAEFQRLSLALQNDGCGLKDSWCAKFARECVDKGNVGKGINKAFGQNLSITRIDASAGESAQFEPIEVKQWHDRWESGNVVKATDEQIAYGNCTGIGWRIISQEHRRLFLNPWTKSGFFVYAEVDELGPNPCGSTTFRVFPRQSDYTKGYIERKWKVGDHNCAIRIHCTFEGADIFKLYEKCRSGREK